MGLISLIVGTAMDANKAIKQKKAQNNASTEIKQVKGLYEIGVPSFLSPSHHSEDASLEYSSRSLDIVMTVIDEPTEKFKQELDDLHQTDPDLLKEESNIEALGAISLSNIFDMDNTEVYKNEMTKINGLSANVIECFQKRSFFKDAIYGYCAFVEGKETMYQILILVGGTSIDKLGEQMQSYIYTFREL